jgi:hypothetical protein
MAQRQLNDMLPASTVDNVSNHPLADAKNSGKLAIREPATAVIHPDLLHVERCQLVSPLLFSSGGVEPALRFAVLHILPVCSEKKVMGITAWTVVAAVAALQPLRNWAKGVLPREPVGHHRIGTLVKFVTAFWKRNEPAVAVMGLVASPRPALFIATFFDFLPEPNPGICFFNHIGT